MNSALLICVDDAGPEWFSCYGEGNHPTDHPATPNIDALAEAGTRWLDAYAYPACSTTRGALMGFYPHMTGLGEAIGGAESFTLPPGVEFWLGHTHYMVGKWHLGGEDDPAPFLDPQQRNVELFMGSRKNLGGAQGGHAAWVKEIVGAQSRSVPCSLYSTVSTFNDALALLAVLRYSVTPWCLWVNFHAIHSPYQQPPGICPMTFTHPNPDLELAGRNMQAVDWCIGELVKEVGSGTNVFVYSDNGTDADLSSYPKAKGTLYEGGVRVPLIATGPDFENEPDLDAQVFSLKHLKDLAFGQGPPLNQYVFAEKFKPNGLDVVPKTTFLRMARSQSGYKLIKNMLTGGEEFYNLNAQPPGHDGPPQLPQGTEYEALRDWLATFPNPFA